MIKKLISILLVIIFLSACAQTPLQTPTQPAALPAPSLVPTVKPELSIIYYDSPTCSNLAELVATYPDATVKVTCVPIADWHTEIFKGFDNKAGADLVIGDSQWIGEEVTGGHLVDLTAFLQQNTDMSDFVPAALAAYGEYPPQSGKYYGAPIMANVQLLVYNKDIFQEYGVGELKTWDDLLAAAQKIQAGGKYSGFAWFWDEHADTLQSGWNQLAWDWGGELWDPATYKIAGIVNSPENIAATDFAQKLFQTGPAGSEAWSYQQVVDSLCSRKSAMTIIWNSHGPAFIDPAKCKESAQIVFAAPPVGPKANTLQLGGQGISLSKYSKNPEASVAFLKWLMSKDTQIAWAKLHGYPSMKSILSSKEFLDAAPYNALFAEAFQRVKDYWNIPEYYQLLTIQGKYLHQAVTGKMDSKTALDAIAVEQQAVINAAYPDKAVSTGLQIATATAGGVWSPIGTALAKLISSTVPGEMAVARETGGAVENLKLLTSGQAEMVFAYDYHIAWLNQGKLPDVVSGPQPARIALGLYEHPLHIVALAGSGINSLADLKGKRVSTGAALSGVEEQAGYVLKALGLDADKDISREKLSLNDSIAALTAGTLDAFFWSGAVPSEAAPTKLVELAADPAFKIVFLPVKGADAEAVMQQAPGVFHVTRIKAGEYPGLQQDVETLGVTAVLAVMDSFPSERLTAILAAIFAHKNEMLTPVWKGAANLTPEKSLSVLAPETRAYLHPAAQAFLQALETLYQVSSINSLFSGHFDGFETVGWLKGHGDLGIGTFDHLNGEMVMLDGLVYQALSDGSLVQPPDSMLVPFANVTHFEPDITLDLGAVESVAALQEALVNMMPRKDAFYAIRVSGTFKQIKVRTIPNQDKPYRPLEEVLKKQIEFEYKDIKGTVVGFWSPDYVGRLNLPGYNLHFISDDHTIGGHLVDAVLTGASASLDETRYFEVKLKPGGE